MLKQTILSLFLMVTVTFPSLAMETDAFQNFYKHAARSGQQNTLNKKALLAWLNSDNHAGLWPLYRGRGSHALTTNYKSKNYASGMYVGSESFSLLTRIDYEKNEENNYKKCNLHHAGFWRTTNLPDDQKTDELDTHFALLLQKLKKCNEITYSPEFKEEMNAYIPKSGKNGESKTLFNLFHDLATCHKDAGKEEKCSFSFDSSINI